MAQPVVSVCFSHHGQYLAAGERGVKPSVRVWDVSTGECIAHMAEHKFGVSSLRFSHDDMMLTTVGFKHDHFLHFWDWRKQSRLGSQKVRRKVYSLAYSADGTRLYICGVRFVRVFQVELTGDPSGETFSLNCQRLVKNALISDHQSATIVDIICGKGEDKGSAYAVSDSGILAAFSDTKMLKWLELDTPHAFAVSVSKSMVAAACSSGVVRLFQTKTLGYIATLPLPKALPRPSVGGTGYAVLPVAIPTGATPKKIVKDKLDEFPACVGIRLMDDSRKVAAIYSDRSLFVWDIRHSDRIGKYRSFLHHSGVIWDIAILPSMADAPTAEFSDKSSRVKALAYLTESIDGANLLGLDRDDKDKPANTDWMPRSEMCVTVSEDGSARLWTLGGDASTSIFSKDQLVSVFPGGKQFGICEAPKEWELPPRLHDPHMLRSVAVHPNRNEFAMGDMQGNLQVFDLKRWKEVSQQSAHSDEVSSLRYSTLDSSEEKCVLASASRDSLVHLFDPSEEYQWKQTFDMHESAVTCARFARSGGKLFTCGGDKTIAVMEPGEEEWKHSASVKTSSGLHDLAVDASGKYFVTAGEDKRLCIWNAATRKAMRGYTLPAACDEIFRIAVDPSGLYVAGASFDGHIRLFDFFSGRCVARVPSHADLTTAMAFTPDCKRLLTVGGDGCIMVWLFRSDVHRAMKERRSELRHLPQQKIGISPPRPPQTAPEPSAVAPPPAPEVSRLQTAPPKGPDPVETTSSKDEAPQRPQTSSPDLKSAKLTTQMNQADRDHLKWQFPNVQTLTPEHDAADTEHDVVGLDVKFNTATLPSWAKTKPPVAPPVASAESALFEAGPMEDLTVDEDVDAMLMDVSSEDVTPPKQQPPLETVRSVAPSEPVVAPPSEGEEEGAFVDVQKKEAKEDDDYELMFIERSATMRRTISANLVKRAPPSKTAEDAMNGLLRESISEQFWTKSRMARPLHARPLSQSMATPKESPFAKQIAEEMAKTIDEAKSIDIPPSSSKRPVKPVVEEEEEEEEKPIVGEEEGEKAKGEEPLFVDIAPPSSIVPVKPNKAPLVVEELDTALTEAPKATVAPIDDIGKSSAEAWVKSLQSTLSSLESLLKLRPPAVTFESQKDALLAVRETCVDIVASVDAQVAPETNVLEISRQPGSLALTATLGGGGARALEGMLRQYSSMLVKSVTAALKKPLKEEKEGEGDAD